MDPVWGRQERGGTISLGELQTQVLVKCSDNPWGTRLALKTLPVAPSFDLKVVMTGAASAETRLLAVLFFSTCWQDWSMYAVIKSGVFISLLPPPLASTVLYPGQCLHFHLETYGTCSLFSVGLIYFTWHSVFLVRSFCRKARVSAIFMSESIFFLQRVHIFFTHLSMQW